MKRFLTFIFAFCAFAMVSAQDMKELFSFKLPHEGDKVFELSEARNLLLIGDEKQISLLDAVKGDIKWNSKFKEISPKLRSVDEIIPMWDAGVVFLFERKMGKDQISVIDVLTGKELWASQKYQNVNGDNVVYISEMDAFAISTKEALTMIKTKNGEELWSTAKFKGVVGAYVYDGNNKTLLMLNYKPTNLAALFAGFKNQLCLINMTNGDIVWETDYRGIVEKKVVTRDPVLKLNIVGERIFLSLNGLQIYKYSNGEKLFTLAYDQTALEAIRSGIPSGYGGRKIVRSTVYNAIADPIIDGNDLYIFDMQDKRHQFVKKYDLNSGKLIWSSPELKQLIIAPNMYKVGDKIILQVGGAAEVQAVCENKVQAGQMTLIYYTNHIFYQNYKPYGVMAFNDADGTQIWRSERFSRGVTNLFPSDNNVIVCSGKAIYSLDINTGEEKYEIPLADDNINNAIRISDYGKDQVLIIGEKGISAHKKSDGSKIWSVRTKRGDFDGVFGHTAFYGNDNGDQFAIDCESGKFTNYDGRKGARTIQTLDGEYLYILEKKNITKAETKAY
jgi:outer membrane protein assembly factor BamB